MRLTGYKEEYLSLIHKWHNDPNLMLKVGFVKSQTIDDTEKLVTGWNNDTTKLFFIIQHKEELIGYVMLAGINKEHKTCELHTLIGEKKYQGQKVCKDVIDEILGLAFEGLNMERVGTLVMENNPKLINTAKKYGWRQEGVLRKLLSNGGERIDCNLFSILKDEWRLICQ